jgi:glutamate/tyrosine decarboxylase-like PLP-dependent enzyme
MDDPEFRTLAHRVVDLLADYLESIDQQPVAPPGEPEGIRALFDEPLPRQGRDAAAVLEELREKLFPYCVHVNHPGYFGLITPTPTPVGILGDFIASAINQNVGTAVIGPAATEIERRTIRWLCDLVGFGPEAGGNLTSGGAMANLIAAKLGRDYASRNTAQHSGVREPYVAYVSEERHVSIDKAFDMVGIGRDQIRFLPTDEQFCVRPDRLEAAVDQDKRRGLKPAVLVAMGGSTATGSVDPLSDLAAIAEREQMWFHVDAAYGGGVLLSTKRANALAGIHCAHSITLDPHKWFFAPLDAGAVLVRSERFLTESFGITPPYLTTEPNRYQFYVHGFEQSRRFRSLKVWMSFKRYGADAIGRSIDRNIEHAEQLYELARRDPSFECVNAPVMSAICLRYRGHDLAFHHRVASEIERAGRYWISTTVLKGQPAFRINPVNFRTRETHIAGLFHDLQDVCARLASVAPSGR